MILTIVIHIPLPGVEGEGSSSFPATYQSRRTASVKMSTSGFIPDGPKLAPPPPMSMSTEVREVQRMTCYSATKETKFWTSHSVDGSQGRTLEGPISQTPENGLGWSLFKCSSGKGQSRSRAAWGWRELGGAEYSGTRMHSLKGRNGSVCKGFGRSHMGVYFCPKSNSILKMHVSLYAYTSTIFFFLKNKSIRHG